MNKKFIAFVVFSIISLVCYAFVLYPLSRGVPSSRPANPQVEKLAYLGELSEVGWYIIDGNDVYIGFRSLDENTRQIVIAAAINGHAATNFGFHAWGVDASIAPNGWSPGQPGYYCEATARYGKIEDTDCP